MHIKSPQDRNEYPDASNIFSFMVKYTDRIKSAMGSINQHDLEAAHQYMHTSRRIFVAGNGGSAAISDHLACDFEKGADCPTVNLSSRPALLSAIANDIGYDYVFSWQLKSMQADPWDIVILISSSGNSPNILEAAKYARSQGVKIIGLTGFDGGKLKSLSHVSLHVNVNNYGIVEDCHQALMHILAQWYHLKRGSI